MEQLKILRLNNDEIQGLPLFYRKIYYNSLIDSEDEKHTYFYNPLVQSTVVFSEDAQIDISKTINYLLFTDEK